MRSPSLSRNLRELDTLARDSVNANMLSEYADPIRVADLVRAQLRQPMRGLRDER
jgi:hypothetical protein